MTSSIFVPNFTDKTPVEELIANNTWRWFTAVPIILSLVFILGMFIIIRHETPVFLISQKRYDEAKNAIKHFSSESENYEQIFDYLKKCTSKETNSVTFKQALCSKKYRKLTLVSLTLAFSLMPNGVFMITNNGTTVFDIIYGENSQEKAKNTLDLISIFDPVA